MSELEVRRDYQAVLGLEQAGILTPLGLVLPTDITFDQYTAMGHGFHTVGESLQWAYGDYLIQGEQLFPDEAAQASELLGISPASRQQYARVAERIPLERRVESLSWSHHREVVALDAVDQDVWLARATEGGWSRQELADHLAEQAEPTEEKKTAKQVLEEALEIVKGAADRVYSRADKTEDGSFIVSAEDMQALGEALGIVEVES